jgi:hypothetical protein
MDISLQFNLESILLIMLIYFILITNTFCSCCNVSKLFETIKTYSSARYSEF